MAKEKFAENPLARTTAQPKAEPEPGDNSDLSAGNVRQPVSVGIREGLYLAYGELAEKYDMSRHQLYSMALTYFVIQVRAGAFDPSSKVVTEAPRPPKKKIKW